MLGIAGHGQDDFVHVFLGIAEDLFLFLQVIGDDGIAVGDVLARHEIVEVDDMFFVPFMVGVFRGDFMLDFVVVDDALFIRIDEEHLARFQAAFIEDVFRRDVDDADFGTYDDPVVAGDIVAGRAQAVAVEHAADDRAVAEADSCRAVPLFEHEVMVAVEITFFIAHEGIPFPRFRNHHHHGVGQGVACHVQVFQAVVEHGRVAARIVDDGEDFFHIREEVRFRLAFTGVEPVDIALDSVDFPIVDDITVRMGPGPAGEGIGTETGMDEGHGCDEVQVRQVEEEVAQLHGRQHALVDDGLRRQAGDVEVRAVFLAFRDDGFFGQFADDVQFPFKVHLGLHGRVFADEDLQEMGTRLFGDIADQAFIDRDVAPAEDGQAFGADDVFKGFHLFLAERFIAVGKNHADAVFAFVGQGKAQDFTFTFKELVRNLDQDAGAVAAVGVGPFGTAVTEVFQDGQGIVDDAVGLLPFYIGNDTDATGIVFI